MQIVSNGENLHEMSKLIFRRKNVTILSSAELSKRVVTIKIYVFWIKCYLINVKPFIFRLQKQELS